MEEAPEEEQIEDNRQKSEHYDRDDSLYPISLSLPLLCYTRGTPILFNPRIPSSAS